MRIYRHEFAVTCPLCHLRHHWAAIIDADALNRVSDAYHITCCGHEIGFSVRRVIGGAA